MEIFTAEIGNIRRKQRKQCLDRGIVQALLQLTTSQPTARPTQMPPAATKRNRKLACASEKVPIITAATAKRNEIKEVASFIRLSPSRITMILRGTRKF